MGTRADFYKGRGPESEWLGSIAWDGYPSALPELKPDMLASEFEAVLAGYSEREDWSKPTDGWPWPWDNSQTTDYAYAFDDGKVWVSNWGGAWFPFGSGEPEESDKSVAFPDMSAPKNVQIGTKRSGIIVIGGV